jgi:hypothetical protein
MSGSVPIGSIIDADGNPTPAMRAWMQAVTLATGGQWDIRRERVNDTTVRTRMVGKDGTARYGPNETLS